MATDPSLLPVIATSQPAPVRLRCRVLRRNGVDPDRRDPGGTGGGLGAFGDMASTTC